MLERSPRHDDSSVELEAIFPESSIVTLPPGTERQTAISSLVQTVVATGRLSQDAGRSILESLLERERFSPSGLWRGFALPHLRTRLVPEVVGAVGIAQREIDFGGMDGVPARTIFLVLSPFERRVLHLQLLSQLAAMIQDPGIAAVLHDAKTGAEMCRLWRLGKSSTSPISGMFSK